MPNRRESIRYFSSILVAGGLSGCIGSEEADQTPDFGLPQCSSSTHIQIMEIDGYNAVIKNTSVEQRVVQFEAYTDDTRADTPYLGTSPFDEYYVVSAGSTLGVELPGNGTSIITKDNTRSRVSFPVDSLLVKSATVTNGTRGEFESSGCINLSEFTYDSDMHEMQTYSTENTSSDWFNVNVGAGITGIEYTVWLSESWLGRNPDGSLNFKLEVDLPNGETVSDSKVIDYEYAEGRIGDVWESESNEGSVNRSKPISKFEDSTYRVYADENQILEESCSDVRDLGPTNGCSYKVTTDYSVESV